MTRQLVIAAAGLCALGLILIRPAPASGPPPEPFAFPPPGVTAIGSGTVSVPRNTPPTQGAIARAVAAATERAAPLAVAAAGRRAEIIAAAAGLRLGAIYGVAPETSGSFGWSAETGTFGPGRYCGLTRKRAGWRTLSSGRRVRRFRSTHACRSPRQVTVNLSVTYQPLR